MEYMRASIAGGNKLFDTYTQFRKTGSCKNDKRNKVYFVEHPSD